MNKLTRTLKIVMALFVLAAGAGAGVASYVLTDDLRPEPELATVAEPRPERILCTGLVEAVGGQIDVMAQLPGELTEVCVTEGDEVQQGDLLAVIDARRQEAVVAVAEADLALAKAKLNRVLAGAGAKEIEAVRFDMEAAKALAESQRAKLERSHERSAEPSGQPAGPQPTAGGTAPGTTVIEFLDRTGDAKNLDGEKLVESLDNQYEASRMRYEALRRGPLPEDVETARSAVALAEKRLEEAKTDYGYHRVVAPTCGTVLKVYRHAGDSVQSQAPTPVVCLADTSRLRIRLEVDETEVDKLTTGMEGVFTLRGRSQRVGRLIVRRVIPGFGPKRLFNPDTSARVDTRTLELLCEVASSSATLYPGQRVRAEFEIDE